MNRYTIHQKITIWQEFTVEAEDDEEIKTIVFKDPALNNIEPISGPEILPDTETVHRTEVYSDDDAEKETLIHVEVLHDDKALLRQWAEWYAKWCASSDPGEVENPPAEETDELLGIVYRDDNGKPYTQEQFDCLEKGEDYAEGEDDEEDRSWAY